MEENKIELLEEILRQQKKEVRHSRIVSYVCLFFVALMLIIAAVAAPRFIRIVNKAEQSFDAFNSFTIESQKTLTQVNSFVTNANDLLTDNTQALSEAIEKISSVDFPLLGETLRETGEKLQSIDFETLNSAIRELESVIKPLSDFFSVFRS